MRKSYELSEALSRLIHSHPFFAVILMDLLVLEETDSVPTAATNGNKLFVSKDWFRKLDLEERVFVLAHEVAHVIFDHVPRAKLYMDRGVGPDLKEFSFNRWNQATDYVINDWLSKSNVGRMPMGGLHHPSYGADDLADDVYLKVPEDKDKGSGGNKDGKGNWDVHLPPDPSAPPPAKSQVQRAVKSAAQAAKAQGNVPAGMERLVDEICEAQVDWKERIKLALHRVAGKDAATWARPNRRRMAVSPHVYWPGTESHQVGTIAMFVDTSGSVSDDEMKHFFGEMHAILTELSPQESYVGSCDTEVHGPERLFSTDELLDYKPKGGGGTHMPAIFDKLSDENITPDALIILTDMYTDFGEPPGYPVIWVATSDLVATHGETIPISIAQH
jgi:predicted metal-dependent peptidase